MKDLTETKSGKPFLNQVVNEDGTYGTPYTPTGSGGRVEYDAKTEATMNQRLEHIGITEAQLIDNIVAAGRDAIDSPGAIAASKWYDTQNKWGQTLADEYGVSVDRVFAATSMMSAMRKWGSEGSEVGVDGTSTNKGAVERLVKLLHDDEPFVVTREMADAFNGYKGEKAKLGEGATIEPGTWRPSDFSSAALSRLVGANGLDLKVMNSAGSKPIARALAVLRGEVEPNKVVRGSKQRTFLSNLVHPEIDYSSTNDLWHMRALAGSNVLSVPDRRAIVNPDGSSVKVTPGRDNRMNATMAEYESHVTGGKLETKRKKNKATGETEVTNVLKLEHGNAPHDLFVGGPPSGGLYSKMTDVTRKALDKLAVEDPRYRGMKIHEFQALIWKYVGGNSSEAMEGGE